MEKKRIESKQGLSLLSEMRDQDADLLESMHYAASQVSQYSPNGTPLLRPNDRSLPMEDVPLLSMSMASTSELLMHNEDMNGRNLKYEDAYTIRRNDSFSSSNRCLDSNSIFIQEGGTLAGSGQLSSSSCLLQQKQEQSLYRRDTSSVNSDIYETAKIFESSKNYNHKDSFRRLLSGEIRSNPIGDEDERSTECTESKGDSMNLNEQMSSRIIPVRELNGQYQIKKELNNLPSISLAQNISAIKTEREGLAKRRRVNEAIQFEQAVGEEISINREDLCIIDDDDDDDDDDDEIEKDIESAENLNHSHHENLLPPDLMVEATNCTPKKPKRTVTITCDQKETPLSKRAIINSPNLQQRRKARPMWPFGQHSEFGFMNHLSDGTGDRTNFVYKGICANPPEITKRGIQRGNYAQLHRKAWLEVSDKYHRYGKNLRLYYRQWERLGFPTNQFFDWLDSKGEAAGQPLPNMDECPRSILDSDTVLYIMNPNITERYALDIVVEGDGRGLVVDVDNDPVNTGSEGWIFILRDNVVYGGEKITAVSSSPSISGHSKQRFHHSSFFGGKAVASAGIIITDNQGYLARLYPHSGHYRPGEAHIQSMLLFLYRKGVDLRTFEMDTQQLLHVSREKDEFKKKAAKLNKNSNGRELRKNKGKDKEEKKLKKVDSLHLEIAVDVACFLSHKADFIGKGIFDKIHKIRKADVTSVTEALNLVNDGPKIMKTIL